MASRYQIVCMVVDCGSLKRAADALGYTQSAVSQAVKALERELGTTIIERGKQGVSLTRDILGKGDNVTLTDEQLCEIIRDNPAGQDDQCTPFILIRKKQ